MKKLGINIAILIALCGILFTGCYVSGGPGDPNPDPLAYYRNLDLRVENIDMDLHVDEMGTYIWSGDEEALSMYPITVTSWNVSGGVRVQIAIDLFFDTYLVPDSPGEIYGPRGQIDSYDPKILFTIYDDLTVGNVTLDMVEDVKDFMIEYMTSMTSSPNISYFVTGFANGSYDVNPISGGFNLYGVTGDISGAYYVIDIDITNAVVVEWPIEGLYYREDYDTWYYSMMPASFLELSDPDFEGNWVWHEYLDSGAYDIGYNDYNITFYGSIYYAYSTDGYFYLYSQNSTWNDTFQYTLYNDGSFYAEGYFGYTFVPMLPNTVVSALDIPWGDGSEGGASIVEKDVSSKSSSPKKVYGDEW